MPYSAPSSASKRYKSLSLLLANLLILLFPPIHLHLADGHAWLAISYFALSPLLLIASFFLLYRWQPSPHTGE